MKFLAVILFCGILAAPVAAKGTPDGSDVLGVWEGESVCQVANSPCRDEHVIYEISRNGNGERIDAFKVVNGEKLFMGALRCQYHRDKKTLSCDGGNPRMRGDWEFFVSGDTMQGTLVIGEEKTLYRKVTVKRNG
jgi:hypothetical protein